MLHTDTHKENTVDGNESYHHILCEHSVKIKATDVNTCQKQHKYTIKARHRNRKSLDHSDIKKRSQIHQDKTVLLFVGSVSVTNLKNVSWPSLLMVYI